MNYRARQGVVPGTEGPGEGEIMCRDSRGQDGRVTMVI